MWNFVYTFKILHEEQFGFRKGHSTIHAIITFLNNIYEKLKSKALVGVFLDLKKAYDCIPHNILIYKLEKIGFRGVIGNWLKNYLSNREQEVMLNDIKSKKLKIERGILQGSTLGCLLFSLYVNDIINVSKYNANIILYADDTSILTWGNTKDQAVENTNENLGDVSDWLIRNKMAINVNKTKYLMFSSNNKGNTERNVSVNNIIINHNEAINFLGLIIDNKLNFKEHIDKINKRLKQLISYCYKIRNKLDDQAKRMFYYAYIYSIITYGIEIYSNTKWIYLKTLDNMHKRVIKVLFSIKKREPTKNIYLGLGFLDLRHIITIYLLKIGFQ